jgi:hypothetical protein
MGMVVLAVAMVAGLTTGSSVPAGAAAPSPGTTTATPTLSVSPTSGPVGSLVTVTFGPADNGCGDPVFEPAAGFTAGHQQLPYLNRGVGAFGDSGTERFEIPRVLASPSAHTNAPVIPGNYQFTVVCDVTNMPDTALVASVPFTVTATYPPQFVGIANAADGDGYWLAQTGGGVFSYGGARFYGSLPGQGTVPSAQIVGIAATPDQKGYWLVGADGGVFSFGDARFFGSMGSQPLNQPIVGMAATPDGKGYWEVASDGGIFAFGSAGFYGSMGNRVLNEPVAAVGVDPITGGYWEVATDGGVFAFDAPFLGSTGNIHLNQPITGMVATPTGRGYRVLAADGGVFDFGDAHFYGSAV